MAAKQDTRPALCSGRHVHPVLSNRAGPAPSTTAPSTQVGPERGEFHRHWAHTQVLHRQGNLSERSTKLGGWNPCLDGVRQRRNALGTPHARAKPKAAIPKLKGAQDADLSLFRGTSVRCLPHILVLRCPISPSSCIPHRVSAGVHTCQTPEKGIN